MEHSVWYCLVLVAFVLQLSIVKWKKQLKKCSYRKKYDIKTPKTDVDFNTKTNSLYMANNRFWFLHPRKLLLTCTLIIYSFMGQMMAISQFSISQPDEGSSVSWAKVRFILRFEESLCLIHKCTCLCKSKRDGYIMCIIDPLPTGFFKHNTQKESNLS